MNWYLKVFKQYADFKGRARRKEYWMFILFNMIFAAVAVILDNVLGIAMESIGYGPIYGLYMLALIIPSLAVGVRRLHDVGKSGWMMLISFIPLVGGIWLFVLFVTDGNLGENEYGLNPKEAKENQPITFCINNSRFSSKFKVCSPLQLSCNLAGKYHAIGYYSYTKHYRHA